MLFTEVKKLIVSPDYMELFVFINPEYIVCNEIPFYDKFLLKKDISYSERRVLEHRKDYIVVTSKYHDLMITRQEIIEYITSKIRSRRKINPDLYKSMSDPEFVEKCKQFYVLGIWDVDEEKDVTIFNLFMEINNYKRFEVYYKLLEGGLYPNQIFYSLLTFVNKVYNADFSEVSKGYGRVIASHTPLIKKNFHRSLISYKNMNNRFRAAGDKDFVYDSFLVLSFIDNLGSNL